MIYTLRSTSFPLYINFILVICCKIKLQHFLEITDRSGSSWIHHECPTRVKRIPKDSSAIAFSCVLAFVFYYVKRFSKNTSSMKIVLNLTTFRPLKNNHWRELGSVPWMLWVDSRHSAVICICKGQLLQDVAGSPAVIFLHLHDSPVLFRTSWTRAFFFFFRRK